MPVMERVTLGTNGLTGLEMDLVTYQDSILSSWQAALKKNWCVRVQLNVLYNDQNNMDYLKKKPKLFSFP